MLYGYIKSVVDMDEMPVVICNMEHTIIYMNPSAIRRYKKYGGGNLIGQSIFDCHNEQSVEKIRMVTEWFKESSNNNKVFAYNIQKDGEDRDVYIIALRNELGELLGYYEKHESRIHDNNKKYDFGVTNG